MSATTLQWLAVTASGYYAFKFTGLQRLFAGLFPVLPLSPPVDPAGNERLMEQLEESWRRAPQARGKLQEREREQIDVNRRFHQEVFATLMQEAEAVRRLAGNGNSTAEAKRVQAGLPAWTCGPGKPAGRVKLRTKE